MVKLKWLQTFLTDKEISKQIWKHRNKIIVTNGIAMLVVNTANVDLTDTNDIKALPDKFHVTMSDFMDYPYRSIQSFNTNINLQHFKNFIGEYESIKECDCKNIAKKCKECDGKGTITCNIGGEHVCWECDGEGTYYCDKCVDGWVKPKPRYVSVLDVVVNGNVLAQYLEELNGDAVLSCNGDNPVKIAGKGWEVYINPVRYVRQEVRRYDKQVS